jgi:osmotically inducible protein OsmC
MPTRKAEAVWEGNLQEGNGKMKLGSGAFEGPFSFGTRFGDVPGTNPEELIGAAHAGCFSMALSGGLGRAGFTAKRIQTRAEVKIERGDSGFKITNIHLITEADVPGIDEATFQQQAEATKKSCPVSQALAAVDITLDAKLVGS